MIPPPSAIIADRGDAREVVLSGPHRVYGRLVEGSTRFDTTYRMSTVERLLAVKGAEWLKDEVDRSEDAEYLPRSIGALFGRGAPLSGRRVLDFGTGCGATAVVLGRLGAAVVGVDPDLLSLAAARSRARDTGVAAAFCRVDADAKLPFAAETFDAVLAYQVFEHIPPPDRAAHARELWRVLRPGGRLALSAPNRLWPQEFHTTGLWWVPWLPDPLAVRYAVWRGRLPAGALVDPFPHEGMRGVSRRDVRAWLPAGEAHATDVEAWLDVSLARPQPAWRRSCKRLLALLLRGVDRTVLRGLGLPAASLLPYVNVVVEKRPLDAAPFNT